MANNLLTGNVGFIALEAANTVLLSSVFNTENCTIINRIGNPITSWKPGRDINNFDAFETGKSYLGKMLTDTDISNLVIPPIPSSGPTTYLNATFNAADHTLLPAYTPITGAAFVDQAGIFEIVGNRAIPKTPTAPGDNWVATSDIGHTDYHITVVGKRLTLPCALQIPFRFTDLNNFIVANIGDGSSNNAYNMYNVVGGTATPFGTFTGVTPTGADVTYELIVIGTSVTLKVNGTAVGSGTVPSTQAGTKVGIGSASTTDVTQVSFASLLVQSN